MRKVSIYISAELPDDERRIQEAIFRQFKHEITRHEIVITINDTRVNIRNIGVCRRASITAKKGSGLAADL